MLGVNDTSLFVYILGGLGLKR